MVQAVMQQTGRLHKPTVDAAFLNLTMAQHELVEACRQTTPEYTQEQKKLAQSVSGHLDALDALMHKQEGAEDCWPRDISIVALNMRLLVAQLHVRGSETKIKQLQQETEQRSAEIDSLRLTNHVQDRRLNRQQNPDTFTDHGKEKGSIDNVMQQARQRVGRAGDDSPLLEFLKKEQEIVYATDFYKLQTDCVVQWPGYVNFQKAGLSANLHHELCMLHAAANSPAKRTKLHAAANSPAKRTKHT